MKTRLIAAVALIVVVGGMPALADKANRIRPAQVRLASTDHGGVLIPVFIGDEGPYRFLLDTGSSHTAIPQNLATALNAVPVAQAPMATSVGSIPTLVVRLPHVAVGSAHVDSLLATVLPRDASTWLGNGINGVLGQDFLSQFDYTLDYRTSRLSWGDEGQIDAGARLALEPSHGRFLVHLPQGERCRCPVRLVPDSGADGVVLFAGSKADRIPIEPEVTPMRVWTLAGNDTARRVTIRQLLVTPATLRNVPAARVVLPAGTIEDGDGLLPLSLFARVSFRHREGYMVVQPR